MSLVVKDTKREYSPAPEGLWPAVCCDVVDLGIVNSPWGEQPQVEIRWILDENEPGKDPKTNRPYMVTRRYRPSLHEKSSLRAMLESWRGTKFTREELEGFDLETLIGVNCQIAVIHNAAEDGRVYSNVQTVVKAQKGTTKLRVPIDYVRMSEREKRRELESNHTEVTDDDIPF